MSPTKLCSSQYPVQNLGSRGIYLLQKVKGCRRGLAAMMRGSNMGILPYGVPYYGHKGASCSNIGRIQTKDNIAVGTLLIGTLPSSLGGFLIVFES